MMLCLLNPPISPQADLIMAANVFLIGIIHRSCITNAASGTNGEPGPWLIANAYEFYAYAARVLDSTSHCSVDAEFVTNSGLGGISEGDGSTIHP